MGMRLNLFSVRVHGGGRLSGRVARQRQSTHRAVSEDSMGSSSSTLNGLLIAAIILATTFFAREVLIPLALAGIFSFMLTPFVRMLQDLRVA
jgi:hypothetical protein